MSIKKLSELVDMARQGEKRKLAVAAAADVPVLKAVKAAQEEGIIEPVLVGDQATIEKMAKEIGFDLGTARVINEPDTRDAGKRAVKLVRDGEAEALMKGNISTGPLLKAVLDKEIGLRKGNTLSHIALFESPYYHKLLCVTDAAMNVAPEFAEKVDMINNAVEAFHKLGIEKPKVAVVGAVEVVNPKMEATMHGALLAQMNKRGQIKGCLVDGPLAYDNAVNEGAAHHKGIKSEVAGDADIILCPDINVGNVLYKSLNFTGGAVSAAVIMGAAAPIVLTSRADSDKAKHLSIALAAAIG